MELRLLDQGFGPGIVLFHLLDEVLNFGYRGEAEGEIEEAGKVHILVDGAGAVGREKYPVVAVVGIAGSRFAAHVGHDAGNNQVLNFQTAQDSLQVGIIEGRIAVFDDNFFVGSGLERLMDFAVGIAFKAHTLPPPAHDAGIKAVRMVHMAGEDNGAAGASEGCDKLFHVGENSMAAAGEGRRGGIKEEVLHIDDHQSGLFDQQLHRVAIEGGDFIEPLSGFAFKGFGSYVVVHI